MVNFNTVRKSDWNFLNSSSASSSCKEKSASRLTNENARNWLLFTQPFFTNLTALPQKKRNSYVFSYRLPHTQTGRKVSQADTCFDKFWSLKFESEEQKSDRQSEEILILKLYWISGFKESKDEKGKKQCSTKGQKLFVF